MNAPRNSRARSDCQRRSVHAAPFGFATQGPHRHSWLSATFTRAKGAIEGAVSLVPVVGGAIAGAVDRIHTGDEHIDPSTGQWVNNSDGGATVGPPSASLAAEIARVQEFNRQLAENIRTQAADTVARAGIGAASAIQPKGVWGVLTASPLYLFGGAILAIGGVWVFARHTKR